MLTSDKLTNGLSFLTTLPNSKPLKVHKTKEEFELLHPQVYIHDDDDQDDEEHDGDFAEIEGADLTFEGPFNKSKKTYVVHAIDSVLIPEAAVPEVKKARQAIEVSGVCCCLVFIVGCPQTHG